MTYQAVPPFPLWLRCPPAGCLLPEISLALGRVPTCPPTHTGCVQDLTVTLHLEECHLGGNADALALQSLREEPPRHAGQATPPPAPLAPPSSERWLGGSFTKGLKKGSLWLPSLIIPRRRECSKRVSSPKCFLLLSHNQKQLLLSRRQRHPDSSFSP